MLIQLILKNFKILKEETLLDCIPGPINEHKASLIKDPSDGEQFLPVIAIHGPNGSGKSTVLYGLKYLAGLLTCARPDEAAAQPIHHRMSPDGADIPTEFDVLYRHKGYLFRYQLHLLKGMITEETLFYGRPGEDDAGILFSRKNGDFHLGKAVMTRPVKHVSQSEPLLSLLSLSSQSQSIQAAFSWFESVHFLPSPPTSASLAGAAEREDEICSLLQAMDLDITRIRITPQDHRSAPGLVLTHTPKGSAPFELSFADESEGIKKLLSILPPILSGLEQGSLTAADDLDSLLHPSLLRYIIGLYTDSEKNPHGSQLIFTSHNTADLMPAILRRDEIWLCAPSGEMPRLYPLSWYKKENGLIPRNDEAYAKQYLEGRYGAIPRISGVF